MHFPSDERGLVRRFRWRGGESRELTLSQKIIDSRPCRQHLYSTRPIHHQFLPDKFSNRPVSESTRGGGKGGTRVVRGIQVGARGSSWDGFAACKWIDHSIRRFSSRSRWHTNGYDDYEQETPAETVSTPVEGVLERIDDWITFSTLFAVSNKVQLFLF